MIKIYPFNFDIDEFNNSNGLCVLSEATDVKISEEINGTNSLNFSLPLDYEKWQYLKIGNYAICDGKIFRVYRKTRDKQGGIKRQVECLHIISDLSTKLILEYPIMIAKTPQEIITEALDGTSFNLLTTLPNNMEWVTETTDFLDVVSKTTPLSIIKALIDKLGYGELYIDNFNIALVKKIVSNTNVLNSTTKFNAKSISDDEDGTELITRLYPFGKDDLSLDSIYIDSPLISQIGTREGYKDYKDIETKAELLTKAQFEFSETNENRIDMPLLQYRLTLIDMYKLYGDSYKIGLGDTIRIIDDDFDIETLQRVVSYDYYPYEPKMSSFTLGKASKNLVEMLKSLVSTEQKYINTLDGSGSVKVEWLANLLKNKSENITSALLANEVTLHKTGDLWIFESETENKAIAIVDGNLAISNTKNSDGTWEWTTFIDGNSVSASVLNSGTLNTNLVDLKSTDGKTTLQGNEFKMVATDGATVSIRATDGTNGIKKGLQIIESFNVDGTPKNYSLYDSTGYKRYINGARIQTYTITASGNWRYAGTQTGWTSDGNIIVGTDGSSPYTQTYSFFSCSGDYFYEWANKYNNANTTDLQKKIMLNILITDLTEPTTDKPVKDVRSSYSFVGVTAVNIGDELYYTGSKYVTSTIKGAYIRYSGRFNYLYQWSDNIWDSDSEIQRISFLANTTMDVD